jgi:hypothetical protein
MIASNKRLDRILIEEYKNIENHLKEININEKARLRIIEGIKLPEDLILSLSIGIPIIWGTIYDYTIYTLTASAIYAIEVGFKIWTIKRVIAYYSPLTRSIYFKKKSLEEIINGLLDTFYSNNIEIKEGTALALKFTGDRIAYYPIYIDKKINNIEEIISKVVIDAIGAHEGSHLYFNSEIKASDLGFLIYSKINNLDKYENTKKVIRKNVEECAEYVKNNKKYDPYSIGECHANITLYENNFSIDIKNEIEKLRHIKDRDIIEKIKNYALNYSN